MSGIIKLEVLLKEMEPILDIKEYVFCTKKVFKLEEDIVYLNPIGTFLEEEGITLIIDKNIADNCNLSYDGIFKKITLNVHSSLEAVGLTAAISNALKQKDISANIVAGFYHDHIFIPKDKAILALKTLEEFSK